MSSRFAPSPTGDLHIGGVRTALFAYLWAKKNKQKFRLRIEDTDKKRSTQQSIDIILTSLAWLGLKYDDDIIFQSNKLNRYKEVIDILLKTDNAYYCTCSKEKLNITRENLIKLGKKAKYDGSCRYKKLTKGVIRFKNPEKGSVVFNDSIKGKIIIANNELDDLIISRADGSPTYNLAVVVDDFDMNIAMVIRGDDHINNTPRQINIYKALNWQIPIFAHVPMILSNDGNRLSKRHGALSIMNYKDRGFLPSAVLNYLVRLGWSYGDKEIFNIAEMIDLFSIENINKSPANFDDKKFLWLNHQHIKLLSAKDIYPHLKYYLIANNINTDKSIFAVIELLKNRSKTLLEMANSCKMFYTKIITFDRNLASKYFNNTEVLTKLLIYLTAINTWNPDNIKDVINKICFELDLGFAKVGQPFRLAISGDGNAGDIAQTATLLGKYSVIERVKCAISFTKKI